MEKLKTIQTNNYQVRSDSYQDREYIVVPVVMMTEGVHNGSHGPIYHSTETLSQYTEAWNGIPVMIDHPRDEEGNYISANSPGQLQRAVGMVFNTHFEGTKLKAEAWLDKQKLLAVSQEASTYIHQNRPLEVSIGAFTEELVGEGEWNGETYTATAQGYRPDHLALLPGGTGACSWADGCGIRANDAHNTKGGKMDEKLSKNLKELNAQGYSISLINNQQGYRELMDKVRGKLDAMDANGRMHFLEEIYDNYIIYRVQRQEDPQYTLYRQTYTVDGSENIQFSGDPSEVRRNVDYVTMSGMRRTKFNSNNEKEDKKMSDTKQPCGECMEKVVALINNKATRFSKADREWLLLQDESTLDKLVPMNPEPVQVNQQQALEVLSETLGDVDKALEVLPADVKARVQLGLKVYDEQRTGLIKEIQANTGDTWSEDELKGMDLEVLNKIHKSVQPKGDYSGQGRSVQVNQGEESPEALYPGGIAVE